MEADVSRTNFLRYPDLGVSVDAAASAALDPGEGVETTKALKAEIKSLKATIRGRNSTVRVLQTHVAELTIENNRFRSRYEPLAGDGKMTPFIRKDHRSKG